MDNRLEEEYYQYQIKGLIMILDDADKTDSMIDRGYVKEKLQMILSGGIGFHPLIRERLEAMAEADRQYAARDEEDAEGEMVELMPEEMGDEEDEDTEENE